MKRIVYISMKPTSTRCPRKNFRDIESGVPIYELAFTKALSLYRTGTVDEVRVVSSDERVKRLLPREFTFVYNPPENEAGYEMTTLNHVFQDLAPDDIVIKISVVNPLIPRAALITCLAKCEETGKPTLVVAELKKLYYTESWEKINFDNPFRGYTQTNPAIYEYTGTLALPKRRFETAFDTPEVVKVSPIEAVDIDTEEDFWLVKAIVRMKGENK